LANTDYLRAHANGTTFLELAGGVLREMEFDIPDEEEQLAIGEVLGAMDARIEGGRRLRASLDALLDEEFRLAVATGTVKKRVHEFAVATKGVSYRSSELAPSETALLSLKCFGRDGTFQLDGFKPYTGRYRPAQAVLGGDAVVAQTDITQGAEVVGRVLRCPSELPYPTVVASLDAVIVRPRDALVTPEVLYSVLRTRAFREHCRAHANGTTVLHMASGTIDGYVASVPEGPAAEAFTARAQAILRLSDALLADELRLVALREVLLPELVTGRLRLRGFGDAETAA
jgi:type I restriction enzyme S subunit